MKATRWHGDGDVRVDDTPDPTSLTMLLLWSASRSPASAAPTGTSSMRALRSAAPKECGSATTLWGWSKRWARP